MENLKNTKKEFHYSIKIVSALYGIILYLYAPMLIMKITNYDLSKNVKTTISLVIAAILCLWFLPGVIGIPKKGTIKDNLIRIGLTRPKKCSRHILLGIILAVITLTGMLIGSILTGLYAFHIETISMDQIYFSLLPGITEEIIFRGFIMAIFLELYNNFKKAAFFQCLVFMILHIGNFHINVLKIIDLLGVFVLSVGFTYVAYKTKRLLAGIIFHFLHDSFLFVVQPAQNITFAINEAVLFYGSLFLSVILLIFVTKFFVEKFIYSNNN